MRTKHRKQHNKCIRTIRKLQRIPLQITRSHKPLTFPSSHLNTIKTQAIIRVKTLWKLVEEVNNSHLSACHRSHHPSSKITSNTKDPRCYHLESVQLLASKNRCLCKDSAIDREIIRFITKECEACFKVVEDQALIAARSLMSLCWTCVKCSDKKEAISRIIFSKTPYGTIKTKVWYCQTSRLGLLINQKVSRWTTKPGCHASSTLKTYLKMKASKAVKCRPPAGQTWVSSFSKGRTHERQAVRTRRARMVQTLRHTVMSRVSCKSDKTTLRYLIWRRRNF
jgi:hypothetical protein